MVEVVSSSQMKVIEKNTDELGVSYAQMMENAGYRAFETILNKVGFASRKCVIFCGSGNNGGDGLVLARYAFEAGADVTVVLVGGYPKSEIASLNMEKVKKLDIPVLSSDFNGYAINEALSNVDIIIDAIYGTGFHGLLSANDKIFFKQINDAVAAIFSLDIPSGVNCDSGEFDDDCINADFTITFDSTKPCHIIPSSAEKCGEVEVVDIGIPEIARKGLFANTTIITDAIFKDIIPIREQNGHKGTFGKVVNISGSNMYMGASVLSCLGSICSGAGYVTLISGMNVCKNTATHIPEITYLYLDTDEYGFIKLPKIFNVINILDKAQAIAIGCGLGKAGDLSRFIGDLIEMQKNPVIIDADGINSLCGNIDILSKAKCPVIITPHPGEMARLLECSIEEVENDRYKKAIETAVRYGITVVLKGHNTLVALPNGEMFVNCTGNSGLSKAGSGDILTGVIAGFCAQGIPVDKAAIAGVYIHGLAAERCSKRLSQHSMRPSDIIYDMGTIFNELENNNF